MSRPTRTKYTKKQQQLPPLGAGIGAAIAAAGTLRVHIPGTFGVTGESGEAREREIDGGLGVASYTSSLRPHTLVA